MRKGASKLRGLKMDARLYTNAMMEASALSVTLIDKILDRMVIERVPVNDSTIVAHTGEILDDSGCKVDIFDKVLGCPLAMLPIADIGTPVSARSLLEPPSSPPTLRPRSSFDSLISVPQDEDADLRRSTTSSMMVPIRLFTSPGSLIAHSIGDMSPLSVKLAKKTQPPKPGNRPPGRACADTHKKDRTGL